MKKYDYLHGAVVLALAISFSACSNDDDIISNQAKEIKAITIAAPSINSNSSEANTRTTLSYSEGDGISINWVQTTDMIRIGYDETSGSYKDYVAQQTGPTTTFTPESQALPFNSGKKYYVNYPNNLNWSSYAIGGNQSQSSSGNTDHLAAGYIARLSGFTMSSADEMNNIAFSKAFATAHGGDFKQSSCLKIDVTLPQHTYGDDVTIKQIKIRTVNESNAIINVLPRKNDGTTFLSDYIINFTEGDKVAAGGGTRIIGYYLLPATDITFPANSKVNFTVTLSNDKYTGKRATIGESAKVLEAGSLGVFKFNGSGWDAWK